MAAIPGKLVLQGSGVLSQKDPNNYNSQHKALLLTCPATSTQLFGFTSNWAFNKKTISALEFIIKETA